MLAFSGCYYGGGDKERRELAAIRRRWKTLHVMSYSLTFTSLYVKKLTLQVYCRLTIQRNKDDKEGVPSLQKKSD